MDEETRRWYRWIVFYVFVGFVVHSRADSREVMQRWRLAEHRELMNY
jgi:hypothetical protein